MLAAFTLLSAALLQDRDAVCRKNLEALGGLVEQYRERFGGPEKAFPKAGGFDLWLALTRTAPPLVTPEELGKLRCPYAPAPPQAGQTNYRAAIPMGVFPVTYVAACEPGHHPDGVIRALERGRAASVVLKPGTQEFLNALERTRGLPGSPASEYFDSLLAIRHAPDPVKDVERWTRVARLVKTHVGLKLGNPAFAEQQLAQAVDRRKVHDEIETEYTALKPLVEKATPEEEKALRTRVKAAVAKAMNARLPRARELQDLERILGNRDSARFREANKPNASDPDLRRALQRRHADNMAKQLRAAIEGKDESLRRNCLRALGTYEPAVAAEAVEAQIQAAQEAAVKDALRAALKEIQAKGK